jgi:hypothetical protein
MFKLLGRVTIPALSLGAALGLFVSPAMAMNYTAPGPYELTPGGSYAPQGASGPDVKYIEADFAHSDVENGGNGTTFNFYFTIGIGSTDYLNVSAPSTGTLEGFDVSTFTYMNMSPPGPNTLVSGPVLINDSAGISLAFTAGASAVNYYLELNLYCGDTQACNTGGDDVDPVNDISLTVSADYTVVSATPLPTALPMMAGGLGFLGFLSWRRKRKAAAIAAA